MGKFFDGIREVLIEHFGQDVCFEEDSSGIPEFTIIATNGGKEYGVKVAGRHQASGIPKSEIDELIGKHIIESFEDAFLD